jgi:hypothetical protein
MNLRADLGQCVGSPVPAVRRLQDHLRMLPRAGHHLREHRRVVADPDRLQTVTVIIHPHDHRPTPVQIDPDKLLPGIRFHDRGLLESPRVCEHSQHPAGS